jgi:hypothetical protein
MKKIQILLIAAAVLIALPLSTAQAADDQDTIRPSKKVTAEVNATLAFTSCVAKLLNNGMGAQEARQLCIDTVAN